MRSTIQRHSRLNTYGVSVIMPLENDIAELLLEFVDLIEDANEDDYTKDELDKIEAQESVVRQQLYIMDSVLHKLEGELSAAEREKQERIFFATRNNAKKELKKFKKLLNL